jgi:hypothetical protein
VKQSLCIGIAVLMTAYRQGETAKLSSFGECCGTFHGLAEFLGRLGLRMCNWALRFRTEFRPFDFFSVS